MTDRLAALVFLVAGGGYLVLAMPYPRGVAAKPGAGFFPLMVGVFVCLVAVAFVIETFRRVPPRGEDLPYEARVRVASTAGALIAFCLLLPWAGYPAVTLLFAAAMLRALGASWTVALATAAVSAGASYYLFAKVLSVPLPQGAIFD